MVMKNIKFEIGPEENLDNHDDTWVIIPPSFGCKSKCSSTNPEIHLDTCEFATKCNSCGRNLSLPEYITKYYPNCCTPKH